MWDYLDDDKRAKLRKDEIGQTLTKELVSPQDIGEVAVFLMTAAAVTGAVIPVDGGRHLKPSG